MAPADREGRRDRARAPRAACHPLPQANGYVQVVSFPPTRRCPRPLARSAGGPRTRRGSAGTMAARCAPLWLFVLGLPLVRSGETEIDFDYLMKQEARTLIMAFYLILFLYPVARWLVNRYTAKIASASQAYLDSLSAKARARVRRARRAPRARTPPPPRSFRRRKAASSRRPPRRRSRAAAKPPASPAIARPRAPRRRARRRSPPLCSVVTVPLSFFVRRHFLAVILAVRMGESGGASFGAGLVEGNLQP